MKLQTILLVLLLTTPLAAAGLDDDAGAPLAADRAEGDIELTPDPLCGDSTMTGFDWSATAASVGHADWRVVLRYQYQTVGGVFGSSGGTREFTSDTTEPAFQTGTRCGAWQWCYAEAELQWWNGADWETKDWASTSCVRL